MVYNANFSSPENDANNNHHGSIHVILRCHENVASISVHHVNGCVIVSQKLQCQREEMPGNFSNIHTYKKIKKKYSEDFYKGIYVFHVKLNTKAIQGWLFGIKIEILKKEE